MIDSKQALFENGLKEAYWIENKLIGVLQSLIKTSYNPKLGQAFRKHHEVTKLHKEKLEKIFNILGIPADSKKPRLFEGMIEDKTALDREISEDLVDSVNVAAAIKTEHIEMAVYQTLIALARELKIRQAIKELKEIHNDEETALRKIQRIST